MVGLLSLSLLLACGGKEGSSGSQDLQGSTLSKPATTAHFDSINELNSQIGQLQRVQETKSEQIARLSKKRDSLRGALNMVESSVKQVNEKKIEPGISGVNTKLDELKGQKENLQEQVGLQRQELLLAEKKIGLLNEEKIVYDAQRKALYGKGAAPKEFVQVDSLLAGINTRISEQANRVKTLDRSIGDIEEQKSIIDSQRGSLSSKVRDNYTAQQIFDDFSKEERSRLEAQLIVLEGDVTMLLEDESQLKTELALNTSKVDAFERNKNASDEALRSEQLSVAKENALMEQEKQTKKKSRMNMALIGIGGLALLLLILFGLGKMRKRKNSQL